jgi:hypothetical protein
MRDRCMQRDLLLLQEMIVSLLREVAGVLEKDG